MYEFMHDLDRRGRPYDPRLPQMLIGDSIAQMRLAFMGGPPRVDRVKEEAVRLTQLGGASAHDLWSSRDYTKPLPDYFLPAGTMMEPDKDTEAWKVMTSLIIFPMQGTYIPDLDTEAPYWPFETRMAAADIAGYEGYKAWLQFRNVYLLRIAHIMGLNRAEDVLEATYRKIGTGELSTWVDGALPPATRVGAETGNQGWLMAANAG
jgi:hypothetical protein